MPSYRVITLTVNIRNTLADFENMVTAELIRGGKPVGGVNVSILWPDSACPSFVYSQAIVYD